MKSLKGLPPRCWPNISGSFPSNFFPQNNPIHFSLKGLFCEYLFFKLNSERSFFKETNPSSFISTSSKSAPASAEPKGRRPSYAGSSSGD